MQYKLYDAVCDANWSETTKTKNWNDELTVRNVPPSAVCSKTFFSILPQLTHQHSVPNLPISILFPTYPSAYCLNLTVSILFPTYPSAYCSQVTHQHTVPKLPISILSPTYPSAYCPQLTIITRHIITMISLKFMAECCSWLCTFSYI
jgi:hypothetical protein